MHPALQALVEHCTSLDENTANTAIDQLTALIQANIGGHTSYGLDPELAAVDLSKADTVELLHAIANAIKVHRHLDGVMGSLTRALGQFDVVNALPVLADLTDAVAMYLSSWLSYQLAMALESYVSTSIHRDRQQPNIDTSTVQFLRMRAEQLLHYDQQTLDHIDRTLQLLDNWREVLPQPEP